MTSLSAWRLTVNSICPPSLYSPWVTPDWTSTGEWRAGIVADLLFLFGSNPHIVRYTCTHFEYNEYRLLDINMHTWINMHMSSGTNSISSQWNANAKLNRDTKIAGKRKKTMEREQRPSWMKKKEKQQKTLEGSLQWMDMIDKDYGAICNWWVTDGESEGDVVFRESLWGRNGG